MRRKTVTRRFGLLESFLSKQRGRKADSLIPPAARTGRILDIGSGAFPSFLLTVDFREKFAIDRREPSSCKGPDGGATISFHQFDLEKEKTFPFDRDCFDVVTMLAVIEHLRPSVLKSVISEVHRVLKPGGAYILTTPAPWTRNLLRAMSLVGLVSPDEIREHKRVWGHSEVLGLLEPCGFDMRRIRYGNFELSMNLWVNAIK